MWIMSESSDSQWWVLVISILIACKEEIKKTCREMRSWNKTKLKEFWIHTFAVLVGYFGIGAAISITLDKSPDYLMIFYSLFTNFEQAFMPAILSTLIIALGILGFWVVYNDTKNCIRVVKFGNCTNFCP